VALLGVLTIVASPESLRGIKLGHRVSIASLLGLGLFSGNTGALLVFQSSDVRIEQLDRNQVPLRPDRF